MLIAMLAFLLISCGVLTGEEELNRKDRKEKTQGAQRRELNRKGRKVDAKAARGTRISLRPLRLLFAILAVKFSSLRSLRETSPPCLHGEI